MTDQAAFQATFCGFRSVGSRKATAITLEVPVEHSERVLRILGHPDPLNPKWFAFALLTEEAAAQSQAPSGAVPTKSPGRKFSELPYSQQAALKCEDVQFQVFCHEEIGNDECMGKTAYAAACTVRQYCGVTSRKDLDSDPVAAKRWDELHDRFTAWRLV